MESNTAPTHLGRKITRIRELRGIKQEYLALELGLSQQTVSRMEASEKIDDELLAKVSKVLGVPIDGIKNFSEETVFNIISNTFAEGSSNNNNYMCTFNPLDKLMQIVEENKSLYERLLKSEQEKVELLKKRVIK